MAYCNPNYTTKKALKEAIASGVTVTVYSPGLGTPVRNGTEYLEGPHYPQPHKWYAQVIVTDGLVTKVTG